MAITHPSDISGLVLDLDPHEEAYEDAAGTTAATVAGVVGNVPDQQATSADVTQSTPSKKPTLQEDANGWRYLDCDGVDDILEDNGSLYTAAKGSSVTLVAYIVPNSETNGLILGWWGTTGNATEIFLWRSNNAWRLARNNEAWTGGTIATTAGQQSFGAAVYDHASGSLMLRVDDETPLSENVTLGWSATAVPLSIGDQVSGGRACDMHGLRFLVYEKALTSTELDDLQNYLDGLYSNPPAGDTTEVSAALALGQISLSAAAEREAALSAALTLSSLAAAGQVEVVQEAGVSAALTLGQLALSGELDREAQLTAALQLGQLAASGDLAREAGITGSLTLSPLGVSGTLGLVTSGVTGTLTLSPLSLSADVDVLAALSASLTLAQLGAGGTVSREAALQAALTLGSLHAQGVIGNPPVLATLEVTLADIMALGVTLEDAIALETSLTD